MIIAASVLFCCFFRCLTTYSKLFRFRWGLDLLFGLEVGGSVQVRTSSWRQLDWTAHSRVVDWIMFVNTGCDVFSLCYYMLLLLFLFLYVLIIYIPTYGLCFRTPNWAGPLCFWREDLTPQQGQGSTLVNPWSWRSCIIQDWPWRSSGVKVVPWCPVVHPHADPNRIYYSCFLPMSVPGPVRFPTTKNGGVIQENCHLLLLDFFLVTPKGAKKIEMAVEQTQPVWQVWNMSCAMLLKMI